MIRPSVSLAQRIASAAIVLPFAFLAGCSMTPTSTMAPVSAGATVSGHIFGGHQPILGATVKLYAAGTTGYGSASTLYATTTSANDAYGSFSFTKSATNTGITGGGATSSYGCPVTGDPEMYLIASGGSTQGAGNGTNPAAVLAVALGKCSTITSSTFVNINEVTTIATMAALQQYFNPNTESFGYAATNQSLLGFDNGVQTISTLANLATGVANTTVTPTSAVAGVTMTATPESTKINLEADVLAACIQTVYTGAGSSTASGNCSTLFANAKPVTTASVTSQPTATFNNPTDTLMAAYYMLSNPTQNQSTTQMANLYGLTSSNSPFQPTMSPQPLDWTISVTYAPSGSCTNANAASFLASAETIAVDGNGIVWFNSGGGNATAPVGNALSAISPTGQPTACVFGNINGGRGLTIDTKNNIWTTSGYATTGAVLEYTASGSALTWPTTTAMNGIVADGVGNIFAIPSSSATPIQEYIGAALATTPAASVSVGGNVTSSTGYLYAAADSSGRIWAAGANGTLFYELYPGGTSPTNGYTLANVGTQLTNTVVNNTYGTAIDSNGNIFGGNTCCGGSSLTPPANEFFKITPASTPGAVTGVNSAQYLGGLVAPRSTAIDGAGNVWAGMGYAAATGTFALAEVDNTLSTSLSPQNTATQSSTTCTSSGSNCVTNGGFEKANLGTVRGLAIDPTGNVWAASNGTTQSIVEMVGAAVPVATPLSVAAANNQLGTKPLPILP